MAKIVNIQNVDPNTLQLQNYSFEDESLISNSVQDITFNSSEDYIEYFVLNLNENIVSLDYNFTNYNISDNLITLDPQKDLEDTGFTEGQYYTIYNFLKRKLLSSPDRILYIQDISSDRTELRLNTTDISNTDLVDLTNQFADQIFLSQNSYLDFYLNFGNNQLIIANNIALDDTNPNDPTVLIKLYEPLPQEFSNGSQCWVVEQIAESIAYQIDITEIFEIEEQLNYISGPNFNLDIQDQINNSTPYYNLTSLQSNTSLLGSGSLLYQINSILAEKGIEISVDYSDYSDFIHFSSALTRLENFYYKLSLIEEYTYNANLAPSISTNQNIWQNKINDIITNFDGYEYYLYYESGSYAWPKTNSTPPYQNLSVNSPQALGWFASQSYSASYYDEENKDNLLNAIPTYLREDDDNDQYFLFTEMIGQHFDNIWIYLKDITNKFNADNRLGYGISKDIVAQAIRDLGVKIYQNNFSTSDLYSALLGITPEGSLFNVPNVTGSLPVPGGSYLEYINTFVTASASSSLEPTDDINKEIYKRIYHNLPALLKRKGTLQGLGLLLDIYGVPDTILRLNEFGGKSDQLQAWDNFAEVFNYAVSSSCLINIPFSALFNSADFWPTTIQFRFKTTGIPSSQIYNQTLFADSDAQISLNLLYSGSNSGSYSGSITSSYNNYGTLEFVDNSTSTSCSVYLPFFDEGWWSVMITTSGSDTYLYAANKLYNGYDGSQIGFQALSSMNSPALYNIYINTYLNDNLYFSSASPYNIFSGYYQEIRYYGEDLNITPQGIPKSVFDDYVMNPYSIEGKTLTGSSASPNILAFRAPLGSMLDNDITQTTRTSIHPAISQYPSTQSFYYLGNSNYTLGGTPIFEPNTEIIYQDQFTSGIKNAVSEKIRIVDHNLPTGNTLSQYISIQQHSHTNESFTKDVNYFEAAFSPQDEINDDIIAQLGSFNLGDYIGDPRDLINSNLNYYPNFVKLRVYYFSKYIHNYDIWDYVRLIKFFDNSLFKMIKDFTPARTGLASGIVIKSTLLDRQRYPAPRVNTNSVLTFVGNPTSSALNIML